LLPLFNLSVSKEAWVLFALLKKEKKRRGKKEKRGKKNIYTPI
jgi:hypothetical protein